MEVMTLQGFLLWLSSAGGASIVASWLLERMEWFNKMVGETKKWVYFASSTSLSVGAYCALTYISEDVLEKIAPFFALIAGSFVVVFLGQAFHKLDLFLNKK